MDNRPIGFFDSGLGGLTSVHELHEKLPNEKVIYFGDTARTPYGSKAVKTIRSFSQQIVEFLKEQNVTVASCPKSNAKLASGIAPITRMARHGVPLAIGTDGAAGSHPNRKLNSRETGLCEEANLMRAGSPTPDADCRRR